jgi:hypothetical protein
VPVTTTQVPRRSVIQDCDGVSSGSFVVGQTRQFNATATTTTPGAQVTLSVIYGSASTSVTAVSGLSKTANLTTSLPLDPSAKAATLITARDQERVCNVMLLLN